MSLHCVLEGERLKKVWNEQERLKAAEKIETIETPYLDGIRTHRSRAKTVISPRLYLQATTAGLLAALKSWSKYTTNLRRYKFFGDILTDLKSYLFGRVN